MTDWLTPCPSCTTPFTPRKGWLHLCHDCLAVREERKERAKRERKEGRQLRINCLRCGDQYERKRSTGHFCDPCVDARKREVDNANQRTRYAEVREIVNEVRRNRPDMDPSVLEAVLRDKLKITEVLAEKLAQATWVGDILGERLEESGLADSLGNAAISPDAGIVGATSPGGPDEGWSTFFNDLAGELKDRKRASDRHPWWKENPHALYGMGEDVNPAYALAPGLVCGSGQGTVAGYWKHRRRGEMACPPCMEAKKEQSKMARERSRVAL